MTIQNEFLQNLFNRPKSKFNKKVIYYGEMFCSNKFRKSKFYTIAARDNNLIKTKLIPLLNKLHFLKQKRTTKQM